MPEDQEDMPRLQSIAFFVNAAGAHSKILTIDPSGASRQIFDVSREFGDTVRVYLTNLYTVGTADYFDILRRHPDVTCIVTASGWNWYTRDAKIRATNDEVGLFVLEEFMGAMNVRQYWNYVKKDDKGKPVQRWR